jgi:NitT/TauT family transport system substrate-binding protein
LQAFTPLTIRLQDHKTVITSNHEMNKKFIFAILGIGIVVLGVAFVFWLRWPKGHLRKMEYDSGGAAVPGLMRNEIDLAIASEFVMVNHLLTQREIRAFGCIDRFENMFLIARKDRRIERITDLKNRKVGVPLGTIAEFYLSRYLTLHGLGSADVTILNVRPDDSAHALAAGNVDAIVTWHPYVDRIMERHGASVIVRPIQSSQLTYWLVIGRPDWMGANRETIHRFLHSISQAEKYASLHPEQAKAVVKKRLGYSDAYVKKIWGDNQFSLSLDQSLIAAMEDEARWVIGNNLTDQKQVPDFIRYIDMDGLKAIRPEAVSIIR